MADVEAIDLDTVGISELLIFWTDLYSYANIVVAWENTQLVTDASRIVEVIPFMSDHE